MESGLVWEGLFKDKPGRGSSGDERFVPCHVATLAVEHLGSGLRSSVTRGRLLEAPPCAALRVAITSADESWRQLAAREPSLREVIASLAAVVLHLDRLIVGHLGDCRVYQLRAGHIIRRTNDHVLPELDIVGVASGITLQVEDALLSAGSDDASRDSAAAL